MYCIYKENMINFNYYIDKVVMSLDSEFKQINYPGHLLIQLCEYSFCCLDYSLNSRSNLLLSSISSKFNQSNYILRLSTQNLINYKLLYLNSWNLFYWALSFLPKPTLNLCFQPTDRFFLLATLNFKLFFLTRGYPVGGEALACLDSYFSIANRLMASCYKFILYPIMQVTKDF